MILLLYVNTAAVCDSSVKYFCWCYQDDSGSSFTPGATDHVETDLLKLRVLGAVVVSSLLSQIIGVVLEKHGFVSALTCRINFEKCLSQLDTVGNIIKEIGRPLLLISYLRVEL